VIVEIVSANVAIAIDRAIVINRANMANKADKASLAKVNESLTNGGTKSATYSKICNRQSPCD